MLEVGVGGHGHLSLEGTGSSIAQPEWAARKTAHPPRAAFNREKPQTQQR